MDIKDCLVMIAESDKVLGNIISEQLQKEGFRTLVAQNHTQAWQTFKENSPHLIIADIGLDGGEDLNFFTTIKNQNFQNNPLMILTTGFPHADHASAIVNYGAVDYLVKPFQVELLIDKLHKAFIRIQNTKQKILFDELEILQNISSEIMDSMDEPLRVCEIMMEYIMKLTQAQYGVLKFPYKETNQFVSSLSKGVEIVSSVQMEKVDVFINPFILRNKQGIIFNKDGKVQLEKTVLANSGEFSLLAIPIKNSTGCIGIINLFNSSIDQSFTEYDLRACTLVAHQAGMALKNVDIESNILKSIDEIHLINSFSEQLAGMHDKGEIVRCLFNSLLKYFNFDILGFLLVNGKKADFHYWTSYSNSDEIVRTFFRQSLKLYNTTLQEHVFERRVQFRSVPLSINSFGSKKFKSLPFQHHIPVEWIDNRFGIVSFGGMSQIENQGKKNLLLTSFINHTRIALINAKLYTDIKENYIRTIKALAIAVDAKDTYTHGHSENVMNIAEELARELLVDERLIQSIRDAGLLHDIGKIGIPGYILNKPGPLTDDEYNGIMKTHSSLGANIVKDVPFLKDLHELILFHHEHYNGEGYPFGLKGDKIPIGARILHVADAFEAMTSNRPYRNSLGPQEAIRRLMNGRGLQFDPMVIDAFLKLAFRKGWIELMNFEMAENLREVTKL